ncbi:putative amino-acid permease [Wickerhamomyces ciferrii]|uniref:Amino-acid permease n=1 Tax=Wickerhamomyces ciferrii (strain ATCC 14091 / BCRC 22168 / CBS 111 / JCM 3599 / NBRC 0793 / NRRL Y-1031 F-60-10) TaxID=1206466 RepID=K0K6E0_WICCF|nr:putative amino-acid permease [Wickerhamomyces ciferrii]CCH40510.1 putative amino-acid permease [Wickerhamomyces ciferrii]
MSFDKKFQIDSVDDKVEQYDIGLDDERNIGIDKKEPIATVRDVSEAEDSDSSSIFGEDRHRLKASLQQRHIQMLALVGVFGTGIFLSSGGVLATAGPAGMFIAYSLVAIIVGLNQIASAEVASLMPVTSATLRHLEHFIDPAWGFANGWIGVWGSILPGEISAAAVIVSYWTDISQAAWITIIIVLIIALNSYNVRFYGEVEFVFAMIKILLLIGLIIVSIVITSGGGPSHETIGFKYWKDPGPFKEYLTTGSLGRFAAFWKTFSGVVFSFGGVQSVPSLAAEVKNPRRNIFIASKRIFYRVTILMMVTVFCLTLIVPSNDKSIANSTGNAQHSPFVVAINNANIKVLPHIINGAVLTSAFSAANLSIVGGSRTLFALAVKHQAPKIFLKTNKRGLPWVGSLFVAMFFPLAYMNVSSSAANIFNWFQSLGSGNLLVGWIFISANHIHMTRAMKAQGISRDQLPHKFRFGPQAAWISGGASLLLLLTGGFVNFVHGKFSVASLFSSYFIIPLTWALYFFWKFFKKTRYYRPHEVDLASLFKDVEENPEEPEPPIKGWRWITLLWS